MDTKEIGYVQRALVELGNLQDGLYSKGDWDLATQQAFAYAGGTGSPTSLNELPISIQYIIGSFTNDMVQDEEESCPSDESGSVLDTDAVDIEAITTDTTPEPESAPAAAEEAKPDEAKTKDVVVEEKPKQQAEPKKKKGLFSGFGKKKKKGPQE